MFTSLDFLHAFPQFSGVNLDLIDSAIQSASLEYQMDLDNWQMITMNLTAHILTMNQMGMSDAVSSLSQATGQPTTPRNGSKNTTRDSDASQLTLTAYGCEVSRLLLPQSMGLIWV